MKKAQITLFIIIGVVALMTFGMLMYSQSGVRKISEQDFLASATLSEDLKPVYQYVASCLLNSTNEALFLLGKQGGYIYASQGGAQEDLDNTYSVLSPLDSFRVPYEEMMIARNQGNCRVTGSDYPWAWFAPGNTANDCFINPISSYPPLKRTFTPSEIISKLIRRPNPLGGPTIQDNMETFIATKLPNCLNLSSFQNMKVTAEAPPVVHVDIGNNTAVYAEYPLKIEKAGDVSELTQFYVRSDVNLSGIYNFMRMIKYEDSRDFAFKVHGKQSGTLLAEVICQEPTFSIVRISDSATPSFSIQYARQNRAPALLPGIITAVPCDINAVTTPAYYDPDDDNNLALSVNELTPGKCTVTVTDGALSTSRSYQ